MKAITQTLGEIVSQAFESAGYDANLGVVTASDRLDLCQFQCNGAFAAAKQYHKAPFIVAEQVAEILKKNANKNAYTGSAGRLRYLIKPAEEALEVQIWNQDVCFALAQILESASFPLSPEGLEEIRAWLTEQYRRFGV